MQTVQTMKKLTKIKLINWHYFQNETINVDGSFLLSGENASGKSTILDAIQLVLTTSTKSFNLATTVGEKRSKRDLKGYVRCKTGEEGNAYYRTGSVISFVALEFYEESKDRFFTIGVKIDSPDVESELKKKWFKVEAPIDAISFIVGNKPALDEQFTVNGKRVSFILTTSEAKNQFRARLGHLDENFFEMIPKSIAFKPMDNVKSFINKFILPEKKIDVDTLRENIRNLREMQTILAEVRKQIAQLQEILSKYEELQDNDRDVLVIDILLKLAALADTEQKIEIAAQNQVKKVSEFERKGHEISEAEQALAHVEDKYNEVQVSIKTSDCAMLISKLQSALTSIEDKKRTLKDQMNALSAQIIKAEAAGRAIETVEVPVTALDIRALNGTEIDDQKKTDTVVELGTAIASEKKNAYETLSDCSKTLQDSIKKQEQLKHDVDLLKKNQIPYPPNTVKLQHLIIRELSSRGIDSDVRILADLLEVTDPEWQNAIEGYLNTQRFNLIVSPDVYDIAAEVYDKYRSEIHTVALVNTGALNLNADVDSFSLAAVVRSENRYAFAYAKEILNRVVRCSDVKELKQHTISITAGCMLYQGKAVRKINPEVYKTPYIGKYAVKRQLELKTEELRILDTTIKELRQKLSVLKEKISILEEFNQELLLQNISVPGAMLRINSEITQLKSEIKEAEDDPNIIELNFKAQKFAEEREKRKKLLDKLREDCTNLKRDCRDIESRIEYLSQERESLLSEIDTMSIDYPEVREVARQKLEEHLKSKSAGTTLDNYTRRRNVLKNQREKKYGELTALQVKYKDGELGTGDLEDVILAYNNEFTELTKHDLIQCEEKLEDARRDCEVEFRENFLSKMRENIERANDIFGGLNKSLKGIRYGQDSYRFILKPNALKEGLHKMITSDINIGGATLFSSFFEEQYHEEMEDLFSKLTESDTAGDSILQEYTDYRGYLDYDIEVTSNGKPQLFSKIYGEKSGGETQTPYYVAIAASFAQMYSLGESIRIMMLDEAFDKMDDERIASMMKFFKDQKFQVILATPPAKMEIIGEYVDDIFVVYREGYNSFIEAYAL